jgi:hypothetical protein
MWNYMDTRYLGEIAFAIGIITRFAHAIVFKECLNPYFLDCTLHANSPFLAMAVPLLHCNYN